MTVVDAVLVTLAFGGLAVGAAYGFIKLWPWIKRRL